MNNDEIIVNQQVSSGEPVVSSPAKHPKNKSKIIIIILAITLIVGLAVIAVIFLSPFFADDNQAHDEESVASNANNDSGDTAKQKPSDTKTEQPKYGKAEVKSAFEKYLDHLILADEENNYNREELYSNFFKSSGGYANTEALIIKMHQQYSPTYGTVGKEIIESINNDFNTFVRMYYDSDFKGSISKSIRTYYYDFALTHIYDVNEIEQEYLNNNNITAEELVQKNLEQNNTDNKTISNYIKLQYWGIELDLVVIKRTSDGSCKEDLKSYITCLSGDEGDSEIGQIYSNYFEAVTSMYNIQTSLRSAAVKEIQRLYNIIYAED